jgi:hypothetical protein
MKEEEKVQNRIITSFIMCNFTIFNNKTDETYSKDARDEIFTKNLSENLNRRDHLRDIGLDGR